MNNTRSITSADLARVCRSDGELLIAARHWTGNLSLVMGEQRLSLGFDDGVPREDPVESASNITLSGSPETWAPILKTKPDRLMTEMYLLIAAGAIEADCDLVLLGQYYCVVARIIELLRPPGDIEDPELDESGATPRFDAPVGRYIHLELGGHDHRIYFEEAGRGGIPLVLQHTAGAHGTQYRHLFENDDITRRFHLIAYDLPFHGKSIPPVSRQWWAETYRLTGEFLRSVPVALASALALDRPVFMGCSVGGLLALDLACHHADVFSHVISLEGALKVDPIPDDYLAPLWHPQVSNDFKARVMNGIMSPTSPVRYRKETSQVYAAGWPNLFLGDLHYYMQEYDLTEKARDIDTSVCGVDILTGEYDGSGTLELGRAAHEAIRGSRFTEMKGIGHFPMSENPAKFMDYLAPVLDAIYSNRAQHIQPGAVKEAASSLGN